MTPITREFTLLFDGACPLCSREARFLKSLDRKGSLTLVDITDPNFDPIKYGRSPNEVDGVIHGVLSDGTVVTRMEVFRRAYTAVGLGWLLAPTGWPILKPIFDWGYEQFAKRRKKIARLFCKTQCS